MCDVTGCAYAEGGFAGHEKSFGYEKNAMAKCEVACMADVPLLRWSVGRVVSFVFCVSEMFQFDGLFK